MKVIDAVERCTFGDLGYGDCFRREGVTYAKIDPAHWAHSPSAFSFQTHLIEVWDLDAEVEPLPNAVLCTNGLPGKENNDASD